MSQNSYELRKQKIEAEAAEKILQLRSERHFSIIDMEREKSKISLPSFMAGVGLGTVITIILMIILNSHR